MSNSLGMLAGPPQRVWLLLQLILMHMRGTPESMSSSAMKQYDDVVVEVGTFLMERVQAAESAGVFGWNIIVDPGIGFAKDKALNLQILERIAELKASCNDLPLLVWRIRYESRYPRFLYRLDRLAKAFWGQSVGAQSQRLERGERLQRVVPQLREELTSYAYMMHRK